MRDTNGAGATGFVATNQVVGHHIMDRDIFEKHGNDGNIFVVARTVDGAGMHDHGCREGWSGAEAG